MASEPGGWESPQLRDLRAEFQSNPALAAEAEGTHVLADVEAFITRYVIVPGPARLVVALWAIATHLAECFDSFPYLSLSSPLPRCGKTRVLEVLELLAARPWRGTANRGGTVPVYRGAETYLAA